MSKTCQSCYNICLRPWLITDPTERLIFLAMSVILNRFQLETAEAGWKDSEYTACLSHADYTCQQLIKIVQLTPEGSMSPIGVRVFEAMAGFVAGFPIRPGSLVPAIWVFLGKLAKRAEDREILQNFLIDSTYPQVERGDDRIIYCLQCGQYQLIDTTQTLHKRHEKVAFTVYCSSLIGGLMNNEQCHASAELRRISICKSHMYAQALDLKGLEFKLLDYRKALEFSRMVKDAFGRGWMDALKCINCYAYNIDRCEYKTESKCKFCKKIETTVIFDPFLDCHAHWACFQKRTCDMQWDLRTVTHENGYPKIRVPKPEEFETWQGADYEKMLSTMRKYFGVKEVSWEHERVQILVMFARYWRHDPLIEQRVAEESRMNRIWFSPPELQ